MIDTPAAAGRDGGDPGTEMLPDDKMQLVTAAVDGELTPAQNAAFRRLLSESAEARLLYEQLVSQSGVLKRLRRASAPADLPLVVLGRVTPIVKLRTPAAAPRRKSHWLAFAVAASAMLAVSAGALWLASRPADPQEPQPFAQKTSKPGRTAKPRGGVREPIPEPEAESQPDTTTEPLVSEPEPTVVAVRPPEAAPTPRAFTPDVIGAALLNAPPPLERVEIRLPFLATVAELDQPDVQSRSVAELGHDAAFRLDLFARDPHRGADVFLAAAKHAGIAVAVDAVAQDRMKRRLPTTWAVYTEALTAEDVAHLMAALAAADRDSDTPVFGSAHLVPARDGEKRELRDILGAEPNLFKRPKSSNGISSGKPLAAGTVDQVTAAINKGKWADKPALLVTLQPAVGRVNPQASKEVREFLARRDDRKPGVVPLFVVIRSPGS